MNNFEHLRDFNVVQLGNWLRAYLKFDSVKNPAIDIETAITLACLVNRMILETPGLLQLSGLTLKYLGEGNRDNAEWAATFYTLGNGKHDHEWYEERYICLYPASARAMHPEEAITRAAAIAGALVSCPPSGGLICIQE
jgi:hypothetical protein